MGSKHNSVYPAVTVTQANGVKVSKMISGARPIQSLQISWDDATAAFTAKLYTSNNADPDVPTTGDPNLEHWKEEPITIVGAAASAAGCDLIHMTGNGARHVLLAFIPTANGTITVTPHERGN